MEITNLNRVKLDFDKFAEKVGVDGETLFRKFTFDVFGGIVEATPIDTGRAMNNWNIAIGQPDFTVIDLGGDKGSILGQKQVEGVTVLEGVRLGQVVFITNSVDYIEFLNAGSSKQAPAAFVERTILVNVSAYR